MEGSRRALAGLSESERGEAMERFQMLRPTVEDGVPRARAAREAGVPLRTAQRWMASYKREGLAGLARRRRSDRGRCRGLPEELERLIEGLALKKPRRSVASVHRRAVEAAWRKGWPEPTYHQVHRIVKRIGPAMVKLAHEGAKAYGQSYDLLRSGGADGPNEVWQADHTPLDVWVFDEKDGPRRPWLTVVLDDFSRAVAGYYLGFEAPSAMGTALALRDAVWRKEDPRWRVCGIPGTFYTDHGPDFTSRHMEQVAADIEMRLVFSTPGEPRGRGKIERFFRTVNQLLLSELPGYAPEGGGSAKLVLTLPELDAAFRSWLLDNYHQRVHGETRQAPLERWEAGGFLPRTAESLTQLDLLLLTVARTRRVRRDGIHFGGFVYFDLALAAYVGEDVTIRYDPRDLAEARVYREGAFLCRAVCHELSGATVSIKEVVRARNRRRRELREGIAERTSLADTVLGLQRLVISEPNPTNPIQESEKVPEPTPHNPGLRLKLYRND